MNNEGWIYIVESKHNKNHIKIGSTKSQTPYKRLKNYATYGGIKIIFACKYNDFSNIETALHIYFGDFFDTNVGGKEWFDLSKKSSQECLYKIFPMLLSFAIDVYKGTSFDYSNEFWEKFDNWLKEHSNDNCKKYNSFLKNKNYTDYREFVLSNSGSKKNNKKQKEKPEPKKQSTLTNKVCKYETFNTKRTTIDWNLFFDDHESLIDSNVYPLHKKNETAKLVKLKTPIKGHNYGILYKNEEMSFNDFETKIIRLGRNPFDCILFYENDKTIKQVYNELKCK